MISNVSIGMTFYPNYEPEWLASLAREGEAAGFDEIWLWEDCFFAGAFSSAATLLAATERVKVGVGLLPAMARNPAFAAMEIATLARLYPGRFIPGMGHGLDVWMKQIGVYPKSPLRALDERARAVRGLLNGEEVTLLGEFVHLDGVRLYHPPRQVPPVLVGGIREKTLQAAGRSADGAILTGMSSPAYVRWAVEQINSAAAAAGRTVLPPTVYLICAVDADAAAARRLARLTLARLMEAGEPHLFALGLEEEGPALVRRLGVEEAARQMPEAWVDALSASGSPEQAAQAVRALAEAGAGTVVLQPVDGDPVHLKKMMQYLMPVLKGG